jgi:DNA polymerase I-like protein with 3'-5' exonuclease and polymerase domains
MEVMPVLMKMEMTGVRIDKTKIDELKIELKQQIDELHIKISSYQRRTANPFARKKT